MKAGTAGKKNEAEMAELIELRGTVRPIRDYFN
jgi:hypothetical protein